jgi:hypothetical protein
MSFSSNAFSGTHRSRRDKACNRRCKDPSSYTIRSLQLIPEFHYNSTSFVRGFLLTSALVARWRTRTIIARRTTILYSGMGLPLSGVPAASLQKFTLAYCTQGQPLSPTFPFQ